jgi:hypothetical protein
MQLKTSRIPAAALLAGLFLAGALPAIAQPAAVNTAQSTTTTQELQKPLATPGTTSDNGSSIPLLYADEPEDVGTVQALQPRARFKYFNVAFDQQLYHSNNPTLAPGNKLGSDISVTTLQASVQSQASEWIDGWDGQARAGVRFQSYWYGVFSGRNEVITGAPIKDSDFTTISPYVEATLRNGDWYSTLGLRYSSYDNNNANADGTFYQEYVPYGTLGYQWNLAAGKTIQFQYDGDWRKTNTPSGGLLPTGWNDRSDQALSIIYSDIINNHWIIQPSYRIMWSPYTNDQRHRNDIYNTVSLLAAYYFNEDLSVRAFTSYEWRSSSEPGNNYENWDLGAGLSFSLSF